MSAYTVNKETIDSVVTTAIAKGVATPETANNIGQILWQQNVDSVNYRYKENTPCEEYVYAEFSGKANEHWESDADCLEYQSCEAPEYDESISKFILDSIREVK